MRGAGSYQSIGDEYWQEQFLVTVAFAKTHQSQEATVTAKLHDIMPIDKA